MYNSHYGEIQTSQKILPLIKHENALIYVIGQ